MPQEAEGKSGDSCRAGRLLCFINEVRIKAFSGKLFIDPQKVDIVSLESMAICRPD